MNLDSQELAKFIEDLGWFSHSYVSMTSDTRKQLDLQVVVTHEMTDNSVLSKIAYGLKRI